MPFPKTLKQYVNDRVAKFVNTSATKNNKSLRPDKYFNKKLRTLKSRLLNMQTNATPVTYIGGSTDEARSKFWKQEPVLNHAVDSIADRYGINPLALKQRINHEGFVDHMVYTRNKDLKEGKSIDRGYKLLNDNLDNKTFYNTKGELYPGYALGFQGFGLDDAPVYINNGQTKLINENWTMGDEINEQGRRVFPANGLTVADNIGITAATLKGFRNAAKKDFPNASSKDLDRYGLIYYNRGIGGGRNYIKKDKGGYNF